jgi:predicted DNA-binding transcriptional regulator AlpA
MIMTVTRRFTFQDGLIGVEALAAILGRSPKAVYDLKYRKMLPPAVRIGGRIYWISEDIEAWLQASKEVI